jgi:glutaredoxin
MAKKMHEVVLYTRAGCHLCDEAEQTLIAHGLRPSKVDIDDDPALRERFNTCVPVVEIDGKIRFRGRVNEVLLRRLIK